MEDKARLTPSFDAAAGIQSITIIVITYRLLAKPSRIAEGKFKGELRGVEFIATSPNETIQWFALNCGQFERVFSRLIPRRVAEEVVDSLTRGEDVVFPARYQREQFGGGFHCERSSQLPDPAHYLRHEGGTQVRT